MIIPKSSGKVNEKEECREKRKGIDSGMGGFQNPPKHYLGSRIDHRNLDSLLRSLLSGSQEIANSADK